MPKLGKNNSICRMSSHSNENLKKYGAKEGGKYKNIIFYKVHIIECELSLHSR
jgi:hypothetical protein